MERLVSPGPSDRGLSRAAVLPVWDAAAQDVVEQTPKAMMLHLRPLCPIYTSSIGFSVLFFSSLSFSLLLLLSSRSLFIAHLSPLLFLLFFVRKKIYRCEKRLTK